MALNINIVKWDSRDMRDIPRHVLSDVPLTRRRLTAIEYRISHNMRIYSTVLYGC